MFGEITLDHEQGLIAETHSWLKKNAAQPAFAAYLERWGDWPNPWI